MLPVDERMTAPVEQSGRRRGPRVMKPLPATMPEQGSAEPEHANTKTWKPGTDRWILHWAHGCAHAACPGVSPSRGQDIEAVLGSGNGNGLWKRSGFGAEDFGMLTNLAASCCPKSVCEWHEERCEPCSWCPCEHGSVEDTDVHRCPGSLGLHVGGNQCPSSSWTILSQLRMPRGSYACFSCTSISASREPSQSK